MKVLAFSLLLLVFFQLEFVIRLDFCADLYGQTARFVVRVFSIRVIKGNIDYFDDGETKAFFLSIGKKRREINIVKEGRKNADSARHLVELVEVSEVGVRAKIGDKDALKTAMLMSSVKIVYYCVIAALKAKQNCKSSEEFVALTDKEALELEFYGILNISIADIIFSAIRHNIHKLSNKLDKEIEYDS